MAYLKEAEPPRGIALEVLPGIRRIVAGNPSSMTYHGTNTYLIEDGTGGLTVLDPGPDLPDHVESIVRVGEGRVGRIFVTHTHGDHVAGLARLKDATAAATYGWKHSASAAFTPDVALEDGDQVAGLTAIFTPGHAADHLCFARSDGVLFSGDHVMSWSSSVVSPPLGRMDHYLGSLNLLLTRDDRVYLSGHGPTLHDPHPHVRMLLAHRMRREAAIGRAVAASPRTAADLVGYLYAKKDSMLRRAAERNVLAHLIKLEAEGRVVCNGEVWSAPHPHT